MLRFIQVMPIERSDITCVFARPGGKAQSGVFNMIEEVR